MVPAPAELASAFRRGEFAGIAAVRPALGKLTRGDSARCAEWVALAHVRLGLLADALSLFDELIEVEPENASHCINLNSTLLAMGRVGEAWQHLRLGLLKWPESLPIRENYGLCCFALHRYEEAALVLNGTASGRGSSSDNARLYGVRALQEMGRFEEALLVSKDWSPDWRRFALAELYQYAKLLIVENRYDVAEPVLLSLCAQAPDETVAPLNLVAIYERSNRLDEAERLLDSLPQSAQTAPLYLLSRGKLHARRSRMTAALDWLDRCTALSPERLEDLEPERYFSEVEFERGRILDALGRFPDAFSAFASANALIRDLHRRYNPEAASAAGIGWLVDSPSMDELVRRTADTQPSTDSPIFIVGFPRSGTTLLDQILDAHPEFQVLEERPALETVVTALSDMPGGYPEALFHITDEMLHRLRALYWQTVDSHIKREPGKRFVDKYPFNLVRLHLAMILFPSAKWIFAIRHPCDVVVSCFMQNFRFTDASRGFWSLEETASIYVQIMQLWLVQRTRLRPDCVDVRYEDLVSDLEKETRKLMKFLGAEWNPGMLKFHEHARSRRIATPSYSQVIQPVYRSAQNRWLNYRPWFGQTEEVLRPFAEGFGYGTT